MNSSKFQKLNTILLISGDKHRISYFAFFKKNYMEKQTATFKLM